MAKADTKVKYRLLGILIEPSRGVVAGTQQVIHQLLLRSCKRWWAILVDR